MHLDLRSNGLDDGAARLLADALAAARGGGPRDHHAARLAAEGADAEPAPKAPAALVDAIGRLDGRSPYAPLTPAFGALDGRPDPGARAPVSEVAAALGVAPAAIAAAAPACVADGAVDLERWRGVAALLGGGAPPLRLDLRANPVSRDGEEALRAAWRGLGPAGGALRLEATRDAADLNAGGVDGRDVRLEMRAAAPVSLPPVISEPAPLAPAPGRAGLWRTIAQLLCDVEDGGGDLGTLFDSWDASSDGECSVGELYGGLKRVPGDEFASLGRADVETLVAEAMDKDADGHVSRAEFLAFAARGRRALAESRLTFEQRVSTAAEPAAAVEEGEPVETPAPAAAPAAAPAEAPAPRDPIGRLGVAASRIAALLIIYENNGGDLGTAFSSLDASGDGAVSAAELLAGLKKLGDAFENTTRADVDAAFADGLARDKGDAHASLTDFYAFVAAGRRQGLGAAAAAIAATPTKAPPPAVEAPPSAEAPPAEAPPAEAPPAEAPPAEEPPAETPAEAPPAEAPPAEEPPAAAAPAADDTPPPLSEASLRVGKLLIIHEDSGSALRSAFDKFDVDSDGLVSVAELHAGLVALGPAFAETTIGEVDKIAAEAFDADVDAISFDKFAAFVARARAQLRPDGRRTPSRRASDASAEDAA